MQHRLIEDFKQIAIQNGNTIDFDFPSGTTIDFGAGTLTTTGGTGGAALVGTSLDITGESNFNGATNITSTYTLTINTADKLVVGGVIVPQSMVVPFAIEPHASLLTRTLFYAQTDGWTVTGLVVVMDLVDDTAITASICKVTGNNVAVAATTPLHTGTFNMQTTAGTPQVATLTSTGADLVLAATNKIGIVFSGALDVGVVSGYIKMKRS